MGRGTQTLDALLERAASPDELERRRRALEGVGKVDALPDGRLVKPIQRPSHNFDPAEVAVVEVGPEGNDTWD